MRSLRDIAFALVKDGTWQRRQDNESHLADMCGQRGIAVVDDPEFGLVVNEHAADDVLEACRTAAAIEAQRQLAILRAQSSDPTGMPGPNVAQLVQRYGATEGLRLARAEAEGRLGTTDGEHLGRVQMTHDDYFRNNRPGPVPERHLEADRPPAVQHSRWPDDWFDGDTSFPDMRPVT